MLEIAATVQGIVEWGTTVCIFWSVNLGGNCFGEVDAVDFVKRSMIR